MEYDRWSGVVRAVVPAVVAWMVGRGWLSEGAAGDVIAAVIAVAAAAWSVYSNRPQAQVANVAKMPGTEVSPDGRRITIIKTELAEAAAKATAK